MQITAKMVAELREKSGAGMMKCKEALVACEGDMEKAMDFLRQKGLSSADKRAGRSTSQGLVVPMTTADKRHAGIVEVNCETDFVAKTDGFIAFANNLAKLVLDNPSVKSVEDLNKLSYEGQSIDDYRKSVIANTGENVTISRAEHLDVEDGKDGLFDTYVHEGGAIGVIVQVEAASSAAASDAETARLAHDVALQAAAMNPIALNQEAVAQDIRDREYKVGYEKAKAELVVKAVNKALEKAGINPAHVDSEEHMESNIVKGWITRELVDKAKEIKATVSVEAEKNLKEQMLQNIAKGRLDKYLKENCLVEQAFVKDQTKTIKDIVEEASKKVNAKLNIVAFRRWARGESSAKAEAAE